MWRLPLYLLPPAFAAAGALAPPVVAPRQAALTPLDRWIDAVAEHEPGRADEAALRVDGWSAADLGRALVERQLRRAVPPPARNDVLKRGAMLHADVAMLRILAGDTAPPARDRRLPASYVAHLDIARQLLDWIEPRAESDPDVRLWYRAVTAWLFSQYRMADLSRHLQWAGRTLRDVADVAFDRGVYEETMAAPAVQNTVTPRAPGMGVTFIVSPAGTHLQRAERAFARALELDPSMTEARIRLGRVLTERGQPARALEHVRRARDETDDPVLAYYAHVFLGRAHEAAGDAASAVEAYRRAAALSPTAPSPVLALAHLAGARGDHPERLALTEHAFRLAAVDRDPFDPWWDYHEGRGRDAVALVDRLGHRIAGLPRFHRSWAATRGAGR